MVRNELEDRLVNFAVSIFLVVDKLPKTFAGKHMGEQLIRSSSSAAMNYCEAQAAESKNDFIHKMKVVLKELRETFISLKIVDKSKMLPSSSNVDRELKENNELIAIFVKSTFTARNNQKGEFVKK